ncbi:NADH dehydrogenase I, H subunit [Candidatus Protochlamydia naegleriophila]|uniref:NADH-quinone oxidoreductase subunit H n=1 Tax=Candidatus Protochlamydia naegleriophila TaxID=389348 RepID=A0A0U5JE17_9BACT|nr:NADH-quinone oxidoreductase subunit NuoH [Candidatus Protochlamydia naegleriophila]CUI17357.1 NADH dehydrogenase I, H subunit [Candidatus Protochlamydia naegleriophila]
MLDDLIVILIKSGLVMLVLFTAAAYMTFLERIVMARLQLRMGPVRVGPLGLFQPLADGIKLLCKERFQPADVETFVYWLAPGISLFTALFIFVLIPFGGVVEIGGRAVSLQIADLNVGIVFLLAFASLAVYGVVLAGWASNNRYSLLGGLRGTAQMISYEIPMGLSLLTVVLSTGTLSLREIVDAQQHHWLIWTNPVSFLIYFITAFAETNRAPFDLPEAEQELTAGYHTEYGGMKFAIFFLGEYINILAVSSIAATLFFGGWHGPGNIPVLWLLVKVAVFVFIFMWVRATMPRFRYDQLMSFGWKVLIPLAIVNLIVTAYFTLV